MGTYRVEIASRPAQPSVEKYKEKMRSYAPNKRMQQEVVETDIKCPCCGQEAPYAAAAMLKVEDNTPVTNPLQQKEGEVVWLCADCFTYGVRPKYVSFGNIKWNAEGLKIQKRAEGKRGHPW